MTEHAAPNTASRVEAPAKSETRPQQAAMDVAPELFDEGCAD